MKTLAGIVLTVFLFMPSSFAAEFSTVKPILENKCAPCHAASAEAPWSDRLFLLNKITGSDKSEAMEHFNMAALLGKGASANEGALRGLEHVIRKKSMPPYQYRFFRRSMKISKKERAAILGWIYSVRPDLKND